MVSKAPSLPTTGTKRPTATTTGSSETFTRPLRRLRYVTRPTSHPGIGGDPSKGRRQGDRGKSLPYRCLVGYRRQLINEFRQGNEGKSPLYQCLIVQLGCTVGRSQLGEKPDEQKAGTKRSGEESSRNRSHCSHSEKEEIVIFPSRSV